MRVQSIRSANATLFHEASQVLVGGVNSPVRSFQYVGGNPIMIEKGKGANVYDYDGKNYTDYVLSYGSLLLGHAHPVVVEAIKQCISYGWGFGTTHRNEIELAQRIKTAIPMLEKIRFVSSGTEAVMGAIRLARGITQRNKILKFEGAYHGHADYLLTQAGSGLATMNLPASTGVPKDFVRHTLVVPYGDKKKVHEIFLQYGSDIAAVIVEPVGGNYGVILADLAFLKDLRNITEEYGALLICDEVITGFRFHYGAAADYFDIMPDLICLGKIIGGGLPVGAYGGAARIMGSLAPLGDVYQASTFAGNPLVMCAGIATLDVLATLKNTYQQLNTLTKDLVDTISREARNYGINVDLKRCGSMFSWCFENKEFFKVFYREALKQGLYFAPSEYEANFISFAHTQHDIQKTIKAIKKVFTILG